MSKSHKQRKPYRYTRALGERICARIMEGASVRKAADEEGVADSTVLRWCSLFPPFAQQYARACEARLSLLEEKMLDLCQQAHEAALYAETGKARMDAIKMELDFLKWYLAKLMPKKYGERRAVELTGAEGAPLLPTPSKESMETLATMLATARAKLETPPAR